MRPQVTECVRFAVTFHLSAGHLQALSIFRPGKNLRPKGVPKVAIRFRVWDVAHKQLRTTLKGSSNACMGPLQGPKRRVVILVSVG